MSQQKRWPKTNSRRELEHKLAENIWWLIVLAHRSNSDLKQALEKFLAQTESRMQSH